MSCYDCGGVNLLPLDRSAKLAPFSKAIMTLLVLPVMTLNNDLDLLTGSSQSFRVAA